MSFCVLANFDCFPVTNSLIKATMGGRQLLLFFSNQRENEIHGISLRCRSLDIFSRNVREKPAY